MEEKMIDKMMEHLEDNLEILDECNDTLKKMKKIEEVLDGEE